MKVTALGVSAAYPGSGEACSGWLVEEGVTKVLVDFGTGVLSNLQKHIPYYSMGAIIVTHMHADHFLDLIPLRYALKYGFPDVEKPRPHLYLPPGGEKILKGMAAFIDPADDFFAQVFEVSEYDPEGKLALGELSATFATTPHYVPAYAVALRPALRDQDVALRPPEADQDEPLRGPKLVAFSGDSAPCQALINLARGADLLVCEATYLSEEEGGSTPRGHMTAREAGETARDARVKRLILTHRWPHHDPTLVLAQATEAFPGPVKLAHEGEVYTL